MASTKIDLKEIQIGQEVSLANIGYNAVDFTDEEYGENQVGKNFMVFEDEKGRVVSFVLVGTISFGYVYRCIYSDFQKPNA